MVTLMSTEGPSQHRDQARGFRSAQPLCSPKHNLMIAGKTIVLDHVLSVRPAIQMCQRLIF